jgi:predicted permease
VFTVQVNPPAAPYVDADRHQSFYQALTAAVAAIPGVRQVAVTNHVPFDGIDQQIAMWLDGYTTDPNDLTPVGSRSITPSYLDAVGLRLVQGRNFTAADRRGSVPVALIDEATAATYWAGRDPVGGRIRYPWGGDWITIVGVVSNAREESLEGDYPPSFYVPFAQRSEARAVLVIASAIPPAPLLRDVQAAVTAIDPGVPVSDARLLEERVNQSISSPRFTATLLLGFASIALLLGAIGIYGLVAYSVSLRLREFGVRMALGASRNTVSLQVIRSSMWLTLAGIVPGLLLALGLTRLIQGLLFGIAPADPVTFTIVPFILGGVALMACWIPARRASRVQPMTVIRGD